MIDFGSGERQILQLLFIDVQFDIAQVFINPLSKLLISDGRPAC